MTRRPIFWLLFIALGIAGVVTAVMLFPTALPSISVDIRMDRGAAIDSAANLSERYSWGAPSDGSAATFGLADDLVQTYVELEGGGREEFERLAARNVYEPYQWRVRRFAEGRVEESLVRFTPQGEPYGFRIRLAEDDAGEGNLGPTDARASAEGSARNWGVDLAAYQLVESSQETLPSGRIDHSFVYERIDEQLGTARFRLRMEVAGARVTELTRYVQIPEAFSRRYADMRSTNDTIALVAQAVLLLIFVLLGAGVGSALLLRERWLVWRAPLAWGAAIAVFFGASTVNRLPLSWTAYDTALSSSNFVLQQLAGGVAIALLATPLIAFFLLAGESLGRRAFPGHIQQWRFWSPEVASSSTALGMTVAAYVLVGLQVGYVVLFYLGTQRLDGWWSPADALVQPDLLATYQPWLEAVATAFFASFWEESVFRAVPIACAALLGQRFGRRGLWIWSAVALQAVVFAAGHANYPQQPPYARVIELTAPALLWGVVYVRYGLVPTIMAHFLYDLSLISIVLFESNAMIDQGVIVLVGLVPLAVVVRARLTHGPRSEPPEWAFNGAWTPSARVNAPDLPVQAGVAVAEVTRRAAGARSLLPAWSVPLASVVGLSAIVVAGAVRAPAPRLPGDRASAVAAATTALEARGVAVAGWTVSVTTTAGSTEGRDYVFAEAGAEAFADLEGSWFGVPSWVVRVVNWEAEAAERVEEYRVWVGPDGEVDRVSHSLPEARPGATLDVSEARELALDAVSRRFGLTAEGLQEVEAQETRRPGRTDWLFTYAALGRLTEVDGGARIQVRVAGDEVADLVPTIYVPEDWQRARRRIESRTQVMAGGLALLLLVGFGAAAVTAVVVWSRRGLPTRILWRLTALGFVGLLASSANGWPATAAAFTTAQPWGVQAASTVVALVLLAIIVAPALGLVGALAHEWLANGALTRAPRGAAVAWGLLLGGIVLVGPILVPRPESGGYAPAAFFVPVFGGTTGLLTPYLLLTSAILAVVALRVRFRHRPFVGTTLWSLAVGAAVVLVPVELQASVGTWILGALGVGSVLALGLHVCSTWPTSIPGIVATALVVQSSWTVWSAPYSGARWGGLIAAVIVSVVAWTWSRELDVLSGPRGSSGQSPEETRASVGSE
jgi:membrane protease YdiL (CAAX protease family)